MNDIPPIYFYLPESAMVENMPTKPDTVWEKYGSGCYSWTLQTYLYLKTSGFPCQLANKIPETGIVLAHRGSLAYNLKPLPTNLLVCLKADQNSHPYAQLHVVQNRQEALTYSAVIQSLQEDRYLLPGVRYYMPHWRQAGLIPRNIKRGDCFENVFFFGISRNITPHFKDLAWVKNLKELGLNWKLEQNRNDWHNYSEVDVVIAVRRFQDESDYPWKPATKLYNAWCAGVPAILGVESAFRAERKSELDYIEVNSVEEALTALKLLRDNPDLRSAMIDNGKKRAKEIMPEVLTQRWIKFLTDICVPEYEKWCTGSILERQRFFLGRYIALKANAIYKTFLKFQAISRS